MSRTNLDTAIQLDANVPPCCGFVKNKKTGYANVEFRLKETKFLKNSAEFRRISEGLDRFFIWDEHEEEWIIDGYYEFWIAISDRLKNRTEVCIRYSAFSYVTEQSEKVRIVRLSCKEQSFVLGQLNEQSKKLFGKTCDELLAEGRKRLEQYLEEET